MLWVVGVNIRFFGVADYGSALTAGHFWQTPECRPSPKEPKGLRPDVRPARWGSGFLRSGIDPGAAATVCFAAPPSAVYDCVVRSLRSQARINPSTQPADGLPDQDQKLLELALIVLSGEKHAVSGFCFALDSPLTPALSRGRGSRFAGCSKFAFDSVSQVGIPDLNNSVGPLSLWERARVRVLLICFKSVFNSVFQVGVLRPNNSGRSPLPLGEG